MKVSVKTIAANVGNSNRQMGGSQQPFYGGIVPGMEKEGVRYITKVVVTLAPGTTKHGQEYILPNGLHVKVDRHGMLCTAAYAE